MLCVRYCGTSFRWHATTTLHEHDHTLALRGRGTLVLTTLPTYAPWPVHLAARTGTLATAHLRRASCVQVLVVTSAEWGAALGFFKFRTNNRGEGVRDGIAMAA